MRGAASKDASRPWIGERLGARKSGISPDTSWFFTDWTQDIDDCDGMANIRYRCSLISNLVSLDVARVTQVRIPMVRD